MKKLLLLVVFVFAGWCTSYGQGDLTLGVNVGLPTGDMSDYSDFQVGADVAYLVGIVGLAEVGPMVGYSHFFSSEDVLDDIKFLPVAASGRLNLAMLMVGLDLGYAVALNDGIDGGLYYRPKVGFNLLGLGLIASYSGISADGGDFSSVNLGVEFSL